MKYDNNNIFAKILRGEIPCEKVFENEFVIAFNDISPSAKIHVLVIPKEPFISFQDFCENASQELISSFFSSITEITKQLNIVESGYRLIANHGADAGQLVPHFHMHILAGNKLGALTIKDSTHA